MECEGVVVMRAQAETLREPIDRIELNITLHIEYCIISMSIDPEALSRILVRLQDSKNDELSSILSALLPKVLPLVNTPSLRDKSMAILTEALKRAKTHGCHLDLRVLEDLIGPSNLPFACNFALAFLDSLDSLNQLTSVNHSSISKVLCAVADHKQHAYQSNILLYFALKHCSLVDYVFCNHPELVTQHDHLKNVLSDYFLDFCIADRSLLSFPTANIIAYGLGDVRKERLLARKKPFPATILSETRMRLLELQFPSLELVLSMVVVCHCDSDSNVSTKADWRVNKLRESGLLECVPHDTFKFLLNLFLGVANIDTGPALLPKRLAFSVPHRASCLRFMLDLISNTKTVCTLQLADLVPVYTILYEERGYSMHKEELDNLLRLLFGLMTKVMISKTFTRDTCNSLMHHLLPLLDSWKMQAPPSTSDTNNIRAACYDLIAALSVDLSFTADANVLAVMMLSLAEVEALGVNSGNLFNALSKIRERMLSEDNSVRIRFDLIQRLRQHTRASCRLAFIQWLDLSDADAQCCIATLSELCDDMDEMVQKTAIFAFKRHVERMTASLDFKNTLHFTMVLIDAFLTSLGSQRLRIKVDSASEGLLMFLQSLWLALNTIYTRMSPDVVQEDASLSSKIINLTNLLGSSLDDNHAVILNSKSLHTYNDERIEERLNNVSSLQDLESGDFEAVELVAGIVELGASLASQSQRDALYETFYDILLQVWTLFPSRIVRGSVASTLSTISVGSASAAYTRVHAVREEYQARAQAVEIVEESLLIRLFNSLAFEAAVLHCLKEPSLVDEYVTSLLLLLDRSIKSTDAGMSVLNVCIIECLGKVGSRSLQRQTNELPAWSIQANEKLSALVKAKDVYVAAAACMALCRLACSDSSRQSFLKTLNVMHSLIKDPKLNSHLVLTAAESYAMTLLISQQQSALHDCAYVGWFKLLSNMQVVGRTALVAACTSIDLLTPSESIVPCAVALHLVFDTAISKSAGPVDFEFIQSSLQFYLLALKADTPLQQDLSCLGICQLYQLCALLDKTNDCSNIPAELLEKHSTLSCYVSSAVAIVLTRETRVAQPIGYNSSSRATRDSASITNSTSTTTTRREDEDNDMDVDELLNAANDASSADMRSLMSGIMRNQRERTQALNQAEENTNFSHPENRYGVYGKICSIAKKSGENAVVILVLSIVRRSPEIMSKGGMSTQYIRYRVDDIGFQSSQISKLIPLLFLAKSDPVTAVRDVMKGVWSHLVKMSDTEVIHQFGDAVTMYALDNLLNPKWREREAACSNLEAVLLHRNWTFVKKYVVTLMQKGFHIMDDLRESTRKAAIVFMKALLSHVLSACNQDKESEEVVSETIGLVLPGLLDGGMLSPSVEARGFTLGAIVSIVKNGRRHLSPWLERLVDNLLESISALEPQLMQYMQFHVQKTSMSEEDYERNRLLLSQNSPMHEALNQCLELVDVTKIAAVCRILYHHLHSGVGLPTRVSAANAFSFLVEKFPAAMSSHGIQAFQLISTTLFERPHLSVSLRNAMVHALGMLSKVVHVESLDDELTLMVQRYKACSSRDSDLALAIAACTQQVIKKAGDRLATSEAIPSLISIAYVGSFDPHQETKSLWIDTFASLLDTTGLGAKVPAISKALSIIARSIVDFLLNLSWERRKQSISIIRDLLISLPDKTLEPFLGSLIAALLSQLKHVPWIGQEQALECIAEIVEKMPNNIQFNLDHPGYILTLPSVLVVSIDNVQDFLSRGSSDLQAQLESILASDTSSDAFLCQQWTFYPVTFAELLFQEFDRKENDFKFAAARSLSLVPWSKASAGICQPFSGVMEKLIARARLLPRRLSAEIESSQSKVSNLVGIPVSSAPSAAIAKRTLGNSALFGNRYGSAPFPARPLKRPAPTPSSIADSLQAAPTPSADARKLSDRDLAGRPADTDAAVRMYLLEAMTCAWQSYLEAFVDSHEQLMNIVDQLLAWMDECFGEEVWSVRKVSVKLLGAIVTNTVLPDTSLVHVLSLLQKAFQEPKYTKVRLEVLETLRVMIAGVNRVALKANQGENIRSFVRVGATDTQPSILEATSKLQHQLLNF